MLKLKAQANPENAAGMAGYGINAEGTYDISVSTLRGMAKEIGKDHSLSSYLASRRRQPMMGSWFARS